MKNIIVAVLFVVLVGFGVYFAVQYQRPSEDANFETAPIVTIQDKKESDTPVIEQEQENDRETIIGESVNGSEIVAFHYGTGDTEILFVGGIHGGYAWNTVLVAHEAMDYLEKNPEVIPDNMRVTVIPVLNPDGLYKVVGAHTGKFTKEDVSPLRDVQVSGRFNAHVVDLNRNFDCDWQSTGMWQKTPVDGGSATFSEPESMAIKKYVETNKPKAVVAWFSSAGGVFSSSCNNGILSETSIINDLYAEASGYPSYDSFDFYATTGDMANWLSKINIPAISVLLTTHEDTEWSKNKAGIEALLNYYKK